MDQSNFRETSFTPSFAKNVIQQDAHAASQTATAIAP